MGGKSSSTKIYDYLLSMHFGICHGTLDSINKIFIKEREAWTAGATADTTITIAGDDLFGGDQAEGGVNGLVDLRLGSYTQLLSTDAASKFSLTPSTMPGFRGVANLFFRGASGAFKWGSNNPYLPGAWVNVTRIPKGLSSTYAVIPNAEAGYPDANGANMIYEIMTDEDWGMGEATTNVNTATFLACSHTLFNEGFGLSMMWAQQSDIKTLLQEIQDHVQATVFVRPSTGQWEMKLLRADYNINLVLSVNPSNAKVTNRVRRLWAETVNEIVISYTNPVDEGDRTTSFQDIANIQMQGGLVSETRNYYGVRSTVLANALGVRDIRAAAYPLFSCDIEGDRSFWDTVPGDILRLDWPEDGISGMALRVTKVDYGTTGSRVIKITAIEDIFGLEASSYVSIGSTDWVDPNPIPVNFDRVEFHTLPMPLILRGGFALADVADSNYPRVVVGVMADSEIKTAQSFDLYGYVVNSTGMSALGSLGIHYPTSSDTLQTALVAAATSTWSAADVALFTDGAAVSAGGFFQIGNGDTNSELVMLYSLAGSTWTIARGVMDTIPQDWPVGSRVWSIGTFSGEFDRTDQAALTLITYRLLPNTGRQVMPVGSAPDYTFTPSERPYQPARPANVKIGAFNFWQVAQYLDPSIPASVTVSWANRNRMTEDTVVLRWDAATTTPETGQTTTIEVREQATGTLLATYSGLTGTSYSLDISALTDLRFYIVTVYSERDGYESIRKINMVLDLERLGYGNNYGYDYGENDGS